MVFHASRLVFHGFRSVLMVFHGSRLVFNGSRSFFMVFHGSRLVCHGSKLVFMVFHGFSPKCTRPNSFLAQRSILGMVLQTSDGSYGVYNSV